MTQQQHLNRLTRLAARLCSTSAAALVLEEEQGASVAAAHGVEAESLQADAAFCSQVLEAAGQVEDAAEDAGWAESRLVREGALRCCAWQAFETKGRRGALVVFDAAPGGLSNEEHRDLEDLAHLAEDAASAPVQQEETHDVEHWHRLAESYDEPIAFAVDAVIAYVNRAALDTFGVATREEMEGRLLAEFVDERQHGMLEERLAALERGEVLSSAVYRIRRPDGTEGFVESVAAPIVYGGRQGMQILLRDVTTEQQHARREHFQAQLLDAAGQALVATDPEGHVTYWNAAAEATYGYTAEEITGRHIVEVMPSEEMQERGAEIFAQLQRGEPWSGDFKARRKDGSSIWVHVVDTPVFDAEGRLTAIIGVSEDITERLETERQLRQSRERLQTVLTHAPLIFYVIDAEGTFLLSRGHGLRALGLEPGEAVGRSVFDLFADEPDVLALVRQALCGEHVHGTVHVAGFWFKAWFEPLRGPEGEREHVLGVARDVTEQVMAEMELQRQRDLLEQTQRLAGAWKVDLRTDTISWSDEVYRIHEVPPGTPIERGDVFDFYAPESRPLIEAATERAIKEGEPFDLELQLLTAAGNRRWVRTVGAAVREGEQTVELVGAFQDVTARKETVLKLREQRRRLQEAQRIAHLGSWSREVESNRLHWSDETYRIFGWDSEEEVTYQAYLEAVHPDDRERVREQQRALMEDAEPLDLEYRILRPDAEERILHGRGEPVYDEAGRLVRLVGTVHDLTERRRTEEALRVRNRAINSTSAGMVITNPSLPDNPIVDCNEGFLQLTGYAREEILGQNCRFLQRRADGTFDHDQPHLDALRKALAAQRPFSGLLRNYRRDGTLFWNRLAVSPVADEHGRVTHFVGVQEDITSRIAYEQGLVDAKARAEEMNRLKDAFLATMSHELRTPLTAVIGYGDLLAEMVDEEHREFVGMIQEAGARLRETLTTVLELAQTQSGARRLFVSDFDACARVDAEVERIRAEAERKDLHLHVDFPEQGAPMTSDAEAVGTIAHGLLSNAVKFTAAGEVRVAVQRRAAAVVFEVSDTGIGIGEEALANIFEPFRQASSGTDRAFEGSGIGLAVVQQLVDLLGGEVEVESRVGEGATFRVTLPRAHEGEAHPISSPASQQPPDDILRERLRVLVVDDVPDVRDLLVLLLGDQYEVHTAAGRREALREAERTAFDLLLLDIHLGGASGLDVLHDLRRRAGYADVPALAVTAHAYPQEREHFLTSGFDGYLNKPFDREPLQQALRVAHALARVREGARTEEQRPLEALAAACRERGLIERWQQGNGWVTLAVGGAWLRLPVTQARDVLALVLHATPHPSA